MTFPLTAYIEAALERARYDKLEDGPFAGEIPKLKGVIAFGATLRQCEQELHSTLETGCSSVCAWATSFPCSPALI